MIKEVQHRVAEIEISYRPTKHSKPKIRGISDTYSIIYKFFPQETIALQERFVAMYLNRQNRVLGVYSSSIGGITGTVVDIRLLLSVALKSAATAIIVAHNHPSGYAKPSDADAILTDKIKKACKTMDISFLDHLIVTPTEEYYSFAEEGIL